MKQAFGLVTLLVGISVVALVEATFYNVGIKYRVQLNMYSGEDDPEWLIDSKHPLYQRMARAVNRGPPTSMYKGLGYQGFTIEANNAIGQRAWKTVGRHTNRKLETLLLRSCPSKDISRSAFNHVQSCIYGHVPSKPFVSIKISTEEKKKRRKRQATRGTCRSEFEPQLWNSDPVTQRRNNCYNYATNIITNTFAQPGRGSGRKFSFRQADDVYQAAVRDGLIPLGRREDRSGRYCVIALYIWPGEDYHFFRKDFDGSWSQKSGRTPARNTDDSGNRIMDPNYSDKGPYTVFAGYLAVPPSIYID